MTTTKKTVKKKARSSIKKTGPTVKKKKVTKKKSRTVKATPTKSATKNTTTKPKTSKKELSDSLTLDSVLVINNAKSLLQDISQLVKTNKDISIDASSVEMVDTAILQLLLAATIKIRSSNHNVNWINPSDNFISNASLLGLSKSLGIK